MKRDNEEAQSRWSKDESGRSMVEANTMPRLQSSSPLAVLHFYND